MFSLIVVLLNFRKYRRSVLFPKILVSAFTGLVLYLCHDLIVILTVGGRKMFSISNLDKGIVSSGSWGSKT